MSSKFPSVSFFNHSLPKIFLQAGNNDSSDDGDGYLMIGGVRINVTPHGNVAGMSNKNKKTRQQQQQRQNRQQHKFSSSSSSDDDESPLEPGEMDSDDMLDYLQNIGATKGIESDDEGNKGGSENEDILATSAGRRRHFEMLRRFGGVEIGDEGAPEDILDRFYDEDDSEETSEEDSDDLSSFSSDGGDDDASLSSFSSGEEEEEDAVLLQEEDGMDVENKGGVLTLAEIEQLPTAIRYPVAVRPTPVLVSGEKQSNGPAGGGSKKKNGKKKGCNSGKFAPGEKARLRREKIESKRAGRAVVRGFDLAGINKQLESFVEKQQDMHAFPPMPKHECRQVQKLAALYGCKAGAQGSGKKRSVMVVMTERTALPDGASLLEIGRLLTAHTAAELGGMKGTTSTTPAVPGLWVGKPTVASGSAGGHDEVLSGKGRWADYKKKGPRSSKSAARKRQEHRDEASLSTRRKHLRPVNFVSKGTINPDDDVFEVVYRPGEEKQEGRENNEEEEDAGPSLLPVFEDRRGGSTPSTSSSSERSSSGDEDNNEEEEDEGEAIDDDDDYTFRPMLGMSPTTAEHTLTAEEVLAMAEKEHKKQKKKLRRKKKKKKKKLKKQNALLHDPAALGLLSYSSRGADAAEGITNSGRLLGLGMALGIGAQVFTTTTATTGNGINNTTREIEDTEAAVTADLSPLEPMLSKAAQKKLAKQKKRGNSNPTTHSTVEKRPSQAAYVSSPPTRTTPRTTTAGARVGVSGEFGDFEEHTTGIGSKLLAKWGFAGAGSGLGRGGTGISEPLQVKMRAKGLGLGAER
jgi:hypothetical protein